MNILHLSSERSWRGGEQQIAYLIEESIKQGISVTVGLRKGSAFEVWCKDNNVPFIALAFSNEFDLKTAKTIKFFCEKQSTDLVHAHSSHSHAMAVLAGVSGSQTPIVLSRRVDFPMKKNFLSKFKFNYRKIAKVVCVSDAINAIMRSDLKEPDKVVTVHSGIDLKRFENVEVSSDLRKDLAIGNSTQIVANISAIAEHKDYPTFLRTAKICQDAGCDFRFVIVGTGPLEKEVKAMSNDLGLNDYVTFLGFRKDIASLMKQIDLFLITSKTEGLGTTVLDAFANKIPVVGTAGGGIPEMIHHDKTGFLADIGDHDKLAELVTQLLADEEKQKVLTENAFALLQSKFTKEETANRTFEIYREILTKNKG